MAKISANGKHAVSKLSASRGSARILLVLRSDGAVLKRFTGDLSNGYSVFTKLDMAKVKDPDAVLRRLANRLGYTWS